MSMKPYNIPVIVKAVNSDFWQTLLSGAKKAMGDQPERIKVTTFGPPEESDINEQVTILEGIVANKPDAVVIASTSNDLTVPAIKKAMDNNIPVVTIDNQVNTSNYISFLATDSVAAAASAADAMVQDWKRAGILPAGKKFVVINSMKESKVDQDRDRGFIERMKELVPNIKMLDVQYVENSATLTTKVVKNLLEENVDLIGIFADNDQTGIGTALGIEQANAIGRVFAYAFDSNDIEIQALKDGILQGMVVQDPFGMGYKGVMIAADAIEGKNVPKAIDTGATIVTKANLDDPKVQKLLYPNK